MIRQSLKLTRFAFASFNASKDYYKILNVKATATTEEIKKSFRVLAKQHHPDANKGNQEKFKEINEAYQVLSSDLTKRDYDEARRGQQSSQSTSSQGYRSQQYRQESPRYQQNTYRGYTQDQGWQNRNYREQTIQNEFRKQQEQFSQRMNSRRMSPEQEMLYRRSKSQWDPQSQSRFADAEKQFDQMMRRNAEQIRITRESVRKAYEAEQKKREQEFRDYRDKQNQDIAKEVKDKAWKMAEGIKDNVEGMVKIGKYVKENLNTAAKLGKFLWDQYKNFKKK